MHKSIVLCDDISTDYLQDIESFIKEWESNSKTIIVHTSGSTGIPKKITLNKENVRQSALATGKFFNFKAEQSIVLSLSPNYIAGKLMIVRALLHDMIIKVLPNQENPFFNIESINANFGAFVPYQVKAILANSKTRKLYECVSNVIIGGASIDTKLEEEIATLNNQSYASFGMTETITHFALRNISENEKKYTCLPGITIKKDNRGCLVINKNKISDQLITNDLITTIDSTSFSWIGRIDNIINSAGLKISPEKIEEQIRPFIPNKRFYIYGQKSDKFGEELVLYIEGDKPSNWADIQTEINAVLKRFYRPKMVLFISRFMETPNGKIIRQNY